MRKGLKNQEELNTRLAMLRELRSSHEASIRSGLASIYDTLLHPAPIIKQCVRDLASDKDFRLDVFKLFAHWLAGISGRKSGAKANSGESFVRKVVSFVSDPRSALVNMIAGLFDSQKTKK